MRQFSFAALFGVATFLTASHVLQAQQTPSTQTPAAPSSEVPIPAMTTPIVDTVDRVVAVVGGSIITWSDLVTAINQQRAQGFKMPTDAEGQRKVGELMLSNLVDEELLIQKAHDLKLEVSDEDVATDVDKQIREARSHFQSETEYKSELKNAGFGTPDEYRRMLLEQARRRMLQQKAYRELSKSAKPGSVSEADVTAAYESAREQLQKRPATVTFRQIIVPTRPSKAADSAAFAKAESLLVKLRAGANFEEMAKRESMDPGTAKLGGNLDWNRRGSGLVPEFEAMMFSLPPGRLSPIVKTAFGYHIILVDRVRPAEVKARHILIAPVIDSADQVTALARADSLAQQWRAGAKFDSLVAKYHDSGEEKGILDPMTVDSLPPSYQAALKDAKAGQILAPFALQLSNGQVKYAVLQVVTITGPGEYSLAEVRERIRAQLASERQSRDMLDELRKQTYVSLRL